MKLEEAKAKNKRFNLIVNVIFGLFVAFSIIGTFSFIVVNSISKNKLSSFTIIVYPIALILFILLMVIVRLFIINAYSFYSIKTAETLEKLEPTKTNKKTEIVNEDQIKAELEKVQVIETVKVNQSANVVKNNNGKIKKILEDILEDEEDFEDYYNGEIEIDDPFYNNDSYNLEDNEPTFKFVKLPSGNKFEYNRENSSVKLVCLGSPILGSDIDIHKSIFFEIMIYDNEDNSLLEKKLIEGMWNLTNSSSSLKNSYCNIDIEITSKLFKYNRDYKIEVKSIIHNSRKYIFEETFNIKPR